MSTNKNATIRYQALDRCFRNPGRRYYIDDLLDACNAALLEIDPESTGINRRQLYYDIQFMKDSLGFDAPIESYTDGRKAYHRYSDLKFSINNQPLNEQEIQQLKKSLMTLSRFAGLPEFEWVEEIKAKLEQNFKLKTEDNVISFEENPFLTGRGFIGILYNAIVRKKVLLIDYKPFKKNSSQKVELHPYHLKQYNNRWFLFGFNEKRKVISNIALDRIVSIDFSDKHYKPNTEIDFEDYFEEIIGVSVPKNETSQKVILKISSKQWPYNKTKPLHGSQKVIEETDEYTVVQLDVIHNHELESLILSFGDTFEVIEPKKLRKTIAERIRSLNNMYIACAD